MSLLLSMNFYNNLFNYNKLALLLGVYVITGIYSFVSPYKTSLANYFQIMILSLCAFLLSFQTVGISGYTTINGLVMLSIMAYYSPLILLLGLLREILVCTQTRLTKLNNGFKRKRKQSQERYYQLLNSSINGESTSINAISTTEVSVNYRTLNVSDIIRCKMKIKLMPSFVARSSIWNESFDCAICLRMFIMAFFFQGSSAV